MFSAQHASIPLIESLERRRLLAGNVEVAFSRGDLLVRGDSNDNLVRIAAPESGTVRVAGLDEETTVNGEAYVDFTGALDDLTIRMTQGGEDQVEVQGALRVGGDLWAAIGDGELVIEGSAGPVRIGGDLRARAGDDSRIALRNHVVVNGETRLIGGGEVTGAAGLGFLPEVGAASFSNPLTIDNPYFPLVLGTTYTYEEESIDDETGETVTETIVVEVTNETRVVMGVENRVVRDRVYVDGLIVEDTFDWHAQDDAGNVWYFGEESTDFIYDDEGNLIDTSTETSWEAGVDGALPGILMLADPQEGLEYYQEFQPGVALDMGKVLATGEAVEVPAGSFDDAVRTQDTSVLSPDELENKFYAAGLGLVQELTFDPQSGEEEGVLRLISATLNGEPVTQVVSPDEFGGENATGQGRGPMWFRDEVLVRSAGPSVFKEARFADETSIIAPEGVTLLDSWFRDELLIRARDGVGMTNVRATDEVSVRGNRLNVFFFDSVFQDEVEVSLGRGDNELVIGDSRFEELKACGGRGDDAFVDEDGNHFGGLELSGFEDQDDGDADE